MIKALFAIAPALLLSGLPPVFAADVDMTSNPVMGCFATLKGQIETGDAAKVETAIKTDAAKYGPDFDPRGLGRLCLDSIGGSLAEGVAIADLLAQNERGTAVGPNTQCISACAIAFMGGSNPILEETDYGFEQDRIIHPTARLGFHSPSLSVPAGSYDEETVGKAYRVALKSVSAVVDRARALRFPVSLIETMLATAPEDVWYVETVGQATRIGIGVHPVDPPHPILTQRDLLNACNNIEVQFLDEDPAMFDGTPEFVEFEADKTGASGVTEGGYRIDGGISCQVWYGRDMPDSVSIGSGDYRQLYAYQFYPASARIYDLRPEDSSPSPTASASLPPNTKEWNYAGTCVVVRPSGNVVDQESCTGQRRTTLAANRDQLSVDVFLWPSGAKTVVEEVNATYPDAKSKLNGAETARTNSNRPEFVPLYRTLDKLTRNGDLAHVCWPNPNSGNIFCYVDKDVWAVSQFDLSYSY